MPFFASFRLKKNDTQNAELQGDENLSMLANFEINASSISLKEDFDNNGRIDLGGQPRKAEELIKMLKDFDSSSFRSAFEEDGAIIRAFDIDKSSIFRLLSQEGCEGIRIYPAVVDGKLTLALVGIEISTSAPNVKANDLIQVNPQTRELLVDQAEEDVIKQTSTLLWEAIK
jgi:hypothetical protein